MKAFGNFVLDSQIGMEVYCNLDEIEAKNKKIHMFSLIKKNKNNDTLMHLISNIASPAKYSKRGTT